MKLPRRLSATPLVMALAAITSLAAPAHAINLAPNGKGEVLIYPYYTVRNGFDTLISVTNASDRTVLANLRLREAQNARSVREFQLALSPHDVWIGAVTIDGSDGALIRTFDTSCTAPAFEAGPFGSKQLALSASGYDGNGALPYDNGGKELSRVQEGFVEVIEMGISTVPESAIPATGTSIETASQHAGGVPRDCATVQAAFANPAHFADAGAGPALPGSPFASFGAPRNVLFGNSTLLNVGSGHAYDATPTTIQNFRSAAPIVYRASSGRPTLAHGDSGMTARQFDRDGNPVTTSGIASPVDAVSVVLMADSVSNEFAAGSTATSSARTDWVITYPTKHFYTDTAETHSTAAMEPFADTTAFSLSGAPCQNVHKFFANREEATWNGFPDELPPFLERPPSYLVFQCSSANVLSLCPDPSNSCGVLVSSRGMSVGQIGTSGWAKLTFSRQVSPYVEEQEPAKLLGFSGVPAIGFAVIERNNSAEAGNNRNFGSGRPHVVELIAP